MKLYIKQKVFSLTDTFVIKDIQGNTFYTGKRKLFSLSANIDIFDNYNKIVATLHQKLFSFLPQYDITISDGKSFTIAKKLDLFASHFIFKGMDLRIDGDYFSLNFTLYKGDQKIMDVSKQFLSIGDSYELDILEEDYKLLCICAVIVIDGVLHSES